VTDWLAVLRANILRRAKQDGPTFNLTPEVFNNCATRTGSLEKPFQNFSGTVNLSSQGGFGLMQNKARQANFKFKKNCHILYFRVGGGVYVCGLGKQLARQTAITILAPVPGLIPVVVDIVRVSRRSKIETIRIDSSYL